jgi:hypothetical protein|tara:strand:- start:579 stop:737 length:159 start_codon:yes stop_codon:yes gene_type:complete
MSNPQIKRLIQKGDAKASSIDKRGSNKKQVVATSGKLRVVVTKDNTNGKAVN